MMQVRYVGIKKEIVKIKKYLIILTSTERSRIAREFLA